MQLPIVAPAPIVTAHADIFRDLFENRCQFRHFQNYLTGPDSPGFSGKTLSC